jgi:hypothetical protein
MQFFTKESNRFTSLHEHSSNANTACITLKLEGLLKIRKLQQWCLCELQFESIKSLLFFVNTWRGPAMVLKSCTKRR